MSFFSRVKPPFSIRATLSIIIIIMGILAIVLSLVAVSIYRDLAFENQRDSLSDLAHLKSKDIINDLKEISGKLGHELSSENGFKLAFKSKNPTGIQTEINEQFFQYYVTANIVKLAKLYVYDVEFTLLTESTKGEIAVPPGDIICEQQLREARSRTGAQRLQLLAELCNYNGRPYYSVISAIGGLSPKGYIQVVTDPSYNLQAIEVELGMPMKIQLPSGETVFQSKNWPEAHKEEDVLIAKNALVTLHSELALTIYIASHIDDLLKKLADTRFMIIFIAVFVTWVTVWIVLWLLQYSTLTPLRSLTAQLKLVRKDKAHLGEQVSVQGNIEVRELAKDFNEMTDELNNLYSTLQDMAYKDNLTRLPNRALFQDRIEQLIELSKRENRSFCIMMMDLDRFKEVNDTLGHEYGDKLLKLVSERLTHCLRGSDSVSLVNDDTIARLGGDEFAALLPTARSPDGGANVAIKMCSLMTKPFKIEEHTFNVGISIGVCMFPQDGMDATTLIRHADIAMYDAKKARKGFTFYNKDLDQHTLENLTLGNELRETILKNKLDLYFQPKIDFNSGKICGAEALVRWIHPERGFIPPDQFVPLAEKIGLIEPLTLWVLNHALEQCARWGHENLPLGVAVNLSALSLHDKSVIGVVTNALHNWKVSPSLLSLELTESAVMSDPEQAIEILTDLNGMGVKLSVDDFGTGFSSLSYLKKLPVDEIKIDRSFVMDMFSDANDETIVRSTIELAHNMNLKVIAEGIEDEATYRRLKNMGCDMGQGYYMGRPSNSKDIAEWMKKSPWGLKYH